MALRIININFQQHKDGFNKTKTQISYLAFDVVTIAAAIIADSNDLIVVAGFAFAVVALGLAFVAVMVVLSSVAFVSQVEIVAFVVVADLK